MTTYTEIITHIFVIQPLIMGSGASSMNQRKEIVGRQLEAHNDICNRIRGGGDNCPGTFYNALNKARDMGHVTPNTYENYRTLNNQANAAKHRW